MTHDLADITRHNSWATATLLEFCRGLDDETLNTPISGTYGPIIDTLRHIINSEMSYLFRASGIWPERPWPTGEPVSLDTLVERSAILASAWEQYPVNGVDVDALAEDHGDDGTVFAVRHGVLITQAIHHGNEHRAQICSSLGARGIEPPDVSAWRWGELSGRSTITTPGTQ